MFCSAGSGGSATRPAVRERLLGERRQVGAKAQADPHMGIGEAGERGERNAQRRGHAAEGEADGQQSGRFIHRKLPELVLQHDGHFLRILRLQSRRHHYARMVGAERQVEMVLAGQPVGGHVLQCAHHDTAHRLLGPGVVGQQAFRRWLVFVLHRGLGRVGAPHSACRRWREGQCGCRKESGGHSVARGPPNRAYCLCNSSERHVVVGTCVLAR